MTEPSVENQAGTTAELQLDDVFQQVPFRFFRTNTILPVEISESGRLVVGVSDSCDPQLLDNLSLQLDCGLETVQMEAAEIKDTLSRLESERLAESEADFESLSAETLSSFRNQVREQRQKLDTSEEAPIASRVNSIIAEGVLAGASDIHFEPREEEIQVRFRHEGILSAHESLPRDILPGLISRIKVMANLDISEQLKPQDGRMNLDIGNKDIDVRVSIVPTVHGERAVLRLLDRDTLKNSPAELGLRPEQVSQVESLLSSPDGIILVTGPTGSGKTTSLYCFLQQLKSGEKNIITLEDPVEYQLEGINQIEIKPRQGLTFASGLRSVLRQDPDIIMVGEIRDRESAELAVHASLTGHLVFTTLHTRSSIGALSRLIDLGLDPYLIGAGVRAIMAQRLIRLLCPECEGGTQQENCEECRGSGFSGRQALFEILEVDSRIRELLDEGAGEEAVRSHLQSTGFQPLAAEGERVVESGLTTAREVSRVLRL